MHCYDGNPHINETSGGLCSQLDLSSPQSLTATDWALSLEVGEHIPITKEGIFLRNVASSTLDGLILSWGGPGQPGNGHVNLRTTEYIVAQMKSMYFDFDVNSTKWFQSRLIGKQCAWWYKGTVLVFRKSGWWRSFFFTESR